MSRLPYRQAQSLGTSEQGSAAVELGQTIREMRTALQRDIMDVAADLRIKDSYLRAIEDGRFRDLPGPAYATGFVRAYADYLGADANEVVRLYKEAIGGVEERTALVLPSPVEEGRLPTGSILLVAGLMAIGAYGGWYYLSARGEDPLQVVAAVPDRMSRALLGGGSDDGGMVAASVDLRTEDGPGAPATPAVIETAATVEAAPETSATPSRSEPAPVVEYTPPEAESQAASAPPPAPANVTEPQKDSATVVAAVEPAAAPPAESDTQDQPAAASVEQTSQPPRETAAASPPPPLPPPDVDVATVEPEQDNSSVSETASEVPPARPATSRTEPAAQTEPSSSSQVAHADPAPTSDVSNVAAVPGPKITLRAKAASWVEVRDDQDRTIYSGLLRAGEKVDLPGHGGMTLATGNAGALEIAIGDQIMPSLGPIGAIRQKVSLDLDSLQNTAR